MQQKHVSKFIQPLYLAENHFLQLLLTQFVLQHHGTGTKLKVRFDDNTKAIWLRQAKSQILCKLAKVDIRRYQEKLDAVLLHRTSKRLVYSDPVFPFRFASGGSLPVIRMGSKDYYCLFYRDIHPIGWNIANGGSDSRDELLNPMGSIERELREELIVVHPKKERRYVFAWDAGKASDHPDFAIARRIWSERFRTLNFPDLKEMNMPLKWINGPDSVEVKYGTDISRELKGCFLNINAEDFGIEVDRVAKLNVDEDAILCDGELIQGHLLNGIIGLFEVKKFNADLMMGTEEFRPDHIYYNAQYWPKNKLNKVLDHYISHLELIGVRSSIEKKQFARKTLSYGLCPVTQHIIKRYLAWDAEQILGSAETKPSDAKCNVFISFGTEDLPLANQVYQYLTQNTDHHIFFSDASIRRSNFSSVIDDALDSARCLVAVGSKLAHIHKGWVEYEWSSFHNDILNGIKPKEPGLVSFITPNFDFNDLPRPLRQRQAIVYEVKNPKKSFKKLIPFLQSE